MFQKQRLKNSKKGFSLPMAMAISVFLVIIATALIFISMQSMSTTSVDVSGRQAYLNVRSAIEYARAYYSNNVADYSVELDKPQYMVMRDKKGGTTGDGADIQSTEPKIEDCVTYVEAKYNKPKGTEGAEDDADDTPSLTLSAFSRYSDAFGNRAKLARLSVTYTIGSPDFNRYTVMQAKRIDSAPLSQESITLHVKKPSSRLDEIVYYIWTYEDVGNAYGSAYDAYEESGGNSYIYDEAVKNKVSISGKSTWDEFQTAMNQSTKKSIYPNAEWLTEDDDSKNLSKGPNGVMSCDSNDWSSGEYYIKEGRVPWFNIIFAKQFSLLAPDGNEATNFYDSQTNEIFHLWYLDPSDKNIYFEFKDKHTIDGGDYYTKYNTGAGWNGTEGLDDAVLVYVRTPKTTIHFRNGDMDAAKVSNPYLATTGAPVINSVGGVAIDTTSSSYLGSGTKKASDIAMEYEGCGWWVANVEANDIMDLTISFSNVNSIKVSNIPANTENKEFWLTYIQQGDSYGIAVYDDERTADSHSGVDPDSYVTVHARVADSKTEGAAPKLVYGKNPITSSTGRVRLFNTIIEANKLNKDDYEETSYAQLETILSAASALVEQEDFIEKQEATTDEEKIKKADEEYNAKADAIENFIRNSLKARAFTQSDLVWVNKLTALYNEADAAVTTNALDYAKDYRDAFVAPDENGIPSNYNLAKDIAENPSNHSLSEIKSIISALQSDFATLKQGYLNKTEFKTFVDLCRSVNPDEKDYEIEAGNNVVSKFNEALSIAENAVNKADTTDIQSAEYFTAWDNLIAAKESLDNAKKSPLKTAELSNAIAKAKVMLYARNDSGEFTNNFIEKKDCTDETFDALKKAYDEGVAGLTNDTDQSAIDAHTAALEDAISKYTVMKPSETIAELAAQDPSKRRIWVYHEDEGSKVSDIWLELYMDTNQPKPVPLKNSTSAWGNCLYHYDVESTIKRVNILATTVTGEKKRIRNGQTNDYVSLDSFQSGNIVFIVDQNGEVDKEVERDGKTVREATIGHLVTVNALFDGELSAKLGSKELPVEREDRTDEFGILRQINVIRYVIPNGSTNNDKLQLTVKTPDPSDPTKDITTAYNVGKLSFGEYVVLPAKAQGTVQIIASKDIYPKYGSEQPDGGDPATPQGAASDTELSDSDIGYLIANDDAELMQMLDRNNDVIYLTDSKWDSIYWGDNSYAYFKDAYNNEVSGSWPGKKMSLYIKDKDGNNIYMVKPPENAVYVYFNNNTSQQSVKTQFTLGTGYSKDKFVEDYEKEYGESSYGKKVFKLNTWKASAFENDYIYIKNNKRATPLYVKFSGVSGSNYHMIDGKGYKLTSDDAYTTVDNCTVYRIQPPKGATKFTVTAGSEVSSETTLTLGYAYAMSDSSSNFVMEDANNIPGTKNYVKENSKQTEEDYSQVLYIVNNLNWKDLHVTFVNGKGTVVGTPDPGVKAKLCGSIVMDGTEYEVYKVGRSDSSKQFYVVGNGSEQRSTQIQADNNKKYYYFIGGTDGTGRWKIVQSNTKYTEGKVDTVDTSEGQNMAGSTLAGQSFELDDTEKMNALQSAEELSMVYTGGNKIRITNKSYNDVYSGKTNSAITGYYIKDDSSCGTWNVKNGSTGKVYLTNNKGWSNLHAYFFNDSGAVGNAWPGYSMDWDHKNDMDQDVYSVSVPDGTQKIIFNNGGSSQTSNILYGEAFITEARPYGGKGRDNDSDNRIGMAQLSPYYDWFEYKIPISNKTGYYFSVKGLVKNQADKMTKLISNSRGNVWLELLSDKTESGKLVDFMLYSYDPEAEDNLTDDYISVFYKKPDKWDDVKITVSGPFGIVKDSSGNFINNVSMDSYNSGRYEDTDVLVYNGIPKGAPFITFTATEHYTKDGAEATRTRVHVEEMQGGDKVLFVPEDNAYVNGGEWMTKVSEYRRLVNNLERLRAAYYGSNIVSKYNDMGELADGAERYYSSPLLTELRNYVKKKGTGYPIDDGMLNDLRDNPSACKSKSDSIEGTLDTYLTLYTLINNSRQYVAEPLKNGDMPSGSSVKHGDGGGTYPQYLHRASNTRQYTASSIDVLKKKLGVAETVFVDGGSVSNAIDGLRVAVAGLTLKSDESIAICLYDSQRRVKENSLFKIKYEYDTLTGTKSATKLVTEYNPEGYPIIFLEKSDIGNNDSIKNVQFIEILNDGKGTEINCKGVQQIMKLNEDWVYIYNKKNPKWTRNSLYDYREITATVFSAGNNERAEFMMAGSDKSDKEARVGPYSPMILLFSKDAEVSGGGVSYTIKAGSYVFTNSDVGKTGSPISSTGILDLYTSNAQTYFTDKKNIGIYQNEGKDLSGRKISGVEDMSSIWVQNNKFITAGKVVNVPEYANFEYVNNTEPKDKDASMVNYSATYTRYEFSANKGISFRWSSEYPLYTSADVKLYADEIYFATTGTIDGTKTRNAHFYLGKFGASTLKVNFRTDVYVRYVDSMGELHNFAIREGTYKLKPSKDSTNGYIANIYDETYWKSMENVEYLGKTGIVSVNSGSTGSLLHPRFGD